MTTIENTCYGNSRWFYGYLPVRNDNYRKLKETSKEKLDWYLPAWNDNHRKLSYGPSN